MAVALHRRYSQRVLYRIVHFINAWFAIAMLWVFIAALLLALSMMFILPPITILLLFLGLIGLGLAVVVARLLRFAQHALARYALAGGVCPRCAAGGQQRFTPQEAPSDPAAPWRCEACGSEFLLSGAEAESSDNRARRHS